jgi:hypothetical protein
MTIEADVPDPHEEIGMFAAYVVGQVIPGIAEFHGVCIQCLGRAIIREIEEALACAKAHGTPDDQIGLPLGSA